MGWAVLSVTPGKAGELLKAYFIQYRLGTPISWSAPAVMAERLTDFISLICLAFLGMLIFESGAFYLVLGGAGIWFAVALGAGVLLVYRSRFEAESEGDAEPVGGRGVQKREGIAE